MIFQGPLPFRVNGSHQVVDIRIVLALLVPFRSVGRDVASSQIPFKLKGPDNHRFSLYDSLN